MPIGALLPLLLAIAIPTCALAFLPRRRSLGATIAAATCLVFGVRYAVWRMFASLPTGQGVAGEAWSVLFLVFEMVTLVSASFLHVFMTRRLERSADVDARSGSALLNAPVDVLIPTYNEDQTILERTILGAFAIEHPDLRVWVLDDGNRPWLRKLAHELGAFYTVRSGRAHAKAGNVNAGLAVCLATGRRPDFVLLLDADFVADRRLLSRTLPLFEAEDVGIVQTPQHFFNADPMQTNLLCTQSWPDEQRFFFNVLLPCKDAWGAAFCCGTSAVFRASALEAIGGLATETVTEDMLTSFKMEEFGWRTIFLNERLSLGLAPEGLLQYVSQRSRWCLGAVQQVFTRWSFLCPNRVTLASRLSSFDGFLYWAFGFSYKLMTMVAPALYWWTGLSVLDGTLEDIMFWFMPYTAVSMLYIVTFGEKRVVPLLTDVSQLLIALPIACTVATALLKPFGRPFRVTDKGLSKDRTVIHWGLMAPLLLLAVATALGMLINMSSFSAARGSPAYAINVVWSVFNVGMLLVACTVCVEPPQLRRTERFSTDEIAWLQLSNGETERCRLIEMSLGGASLVRTGAADILDPESDQPRTGVLMLDGGSLCVPAEIVRADTDRVSLRFDLDVGLRRQLIVKLFTGRYSNEVESVEIITTARSILRRVMG